MKKKKKSLVSIYTLTRTKLAWIFRLLSHYNEEEAGDVIAQLNRPERVTAT